MQLEMGSFPPAFYVPRCLCAGELASEGLTSSSKSHAGTPAPNSALTLLRCVEMEAILGATTRDVADGKAAPVENGGGRQHREGGRRQGLLLG